MRRRECSGSGIAAIIRRRSSLAAANAEQPSEHLEVLERSGGLLRRLLMLHHPSSIKLSGGVDVTGRAIPRPSDTPSVALLGTPAGRRGRGAARMALKGRRRSAGQWSGSGTIQLAGQSEQIDCRASYDILNEQQKLQLNIRCEQRQPSRPRKQVLAFVAARRRNLYCLMRVERVPIAAGLGRAS